MKLLICIAFHYDMNNIEFLYKVINNILETYTYDTYMCVCAQLSLYLYICAYFAQLYHADFALAIAWHCYRRGAMFC